MSNNPNEILRQDAARRKIKSDDPIFKEVVEYLNKCRDSFSKYFGDKGKFWFDYTMIRLGLYNYPDGKEEKIQRISRQLINFKILKDEKIQLPYIKEEDGKVEFGNVIFAEHGFTKIDEANHTVEGYANTVIADLVDDLILPSAYKDTASKLKKTYFMHHTDMPDGEILESRFDDIGWYVKSHLDDWAWAKVMDGTITGYSIGGRVTMFPEFVGAVAVYKEAGAVEIDDLSHVTRPCNQLSMFKMDAPVFDKSKSQKTEPSHVTAGVGTNVKGSKNKIRKSENLSEQNEQPIQKSTVEEIETLLKERDAETEKRLLEGLKKKKADEAKAQEESRVSKLEESFGKFMSDVNTKLASIMKTLEDSTAKIAKIEAEPAVKPIVQKNDVPSTVEIAKSSANFSEFHERMQKAEVPA